MLTRAALLSCGATGGLVLLAWYDSMLLAVLLGSVLSWAWLMDWCKGSYCSSPARLDGKIAVVTGSNTGIGMETARALAVRGARVVLACRDLGKGEVARQQIMQETGGNIQVMYLDLANFASVRQFAGELAAKFSKLDILVNNAGVGLQPKKITVDGLEQVMQVNHLSHFLLTNLLVDLLKAAGKARVINVSSVCHSWNWLLKQGIQWDDLKWERTPFSSWGAYAQSKLANILFTRELAERQANTGITVYAVHPGSVNTQLSSCLWEKIPSFLRGYLKALMNTFLQTAEGGAQTSVYCAVEESLEGETGMYYSNCARAEPKSAALNNVQAKKMWEVSKDIVGDISPVKPAGKPIVETIGLVNTSDTNSVVGTTNTNLMSDIKLFSEGASLTPVKSAEPLSGSDLFVQEMMVKDVKTFDRTELRKTETLEPMSGPELVRKEMETKSLNVEVTNFDKSELHETRVEEKNVLPDLRDIKLEKDKIELIGGIENFDVDNLSRVTVKEPLSGVELLRQELSHKAVQDQIGSFDQEGLRSTEVKDSSWLPDRQDIEEEREKVDHLAGIQRFDTEALHKVKTLEPLSGAELLKRELTLKAVTEELGSFDVGTMKHTSVEEKNLLPDPSILAEEKTRETLLTGVEQFSHESLSHVKTPEPVSGAELVRQELTIKSIVNSVTTFDSSSLRSAITTEKTMLPDAETIETERHRMSLLKSLESEHSLSPVTSKEPVSGAALVKQELTRQKVMEGVETFNMEGLRHSEVQEKAVLPDMTTIQEERIHVEHLAGIGAFDQSSLTPVKVAEPLTGPELVKQENLRDSISEELVTFDKTELKETNVEEKSVLPGVEDIQAERQHMDLLQGLESGMELKKTETREPTNPLELARMELHKDQVEEELQAFDRARLTPVITEEKVFLPSAEELRAAVVGEEMDDALEAPSSSSSSSKGASGLRDLLTEEDSREQRSSSEEWEKVDGGDSEC